MARGRDSSRPLFGQKIFPFRLLLRSNSTPSRARGNWESLFSTPGALPFNTHPPSSICSNRHMDLWFLFQRVSRKQMRCCWYARSGTVWTAKLFFVAYNLSTPQVLKVAPTSEWYIIRLTAKGISYHFISSLLFTGEVSFQVKVFVDFTIQRFRTFLFAVLLHPEVLSMKQ